MNIAEQQLIGATPLGNERCRFIVWAPRADRVDLELDTHPVRSLSLPPQGDGYFHLDVDDVPVGTRYKFRLDHGPPRPDPASRFQPQGVHGPSQVIDHHFPWTDHAWRGLPIHDYIIYELHVGTFTTEGTFDAVIDQLRQLQELGITAIELMPVAQFPGSRNWGYDGVHPFAVQESYGGPAGLRRLVNHCHQHGFAVILDVVYNHFGPEGNYLDEFGPYFTKKYQTPWGAAINLDDEYSDHVRRYFIDNALHWFRDFHIDALRLDAVHAIHDESAIPFLCELAAAVDQESRRSTRHHYLIEENDRNDARHVLAPQQGGYGLAAVWNDDFHHSLHAALTGERNGYYEDFGSLNELAKSLQEGFVYTGQYSRFRKRRHGSSSVDVPAERLVVFAQNHDQIGNRMFGERLGRLVSLEALKLAAGVTLLAPRVPLLFMGEEYDDPAPFLYFVSHRDEALIEAVRRGRRQEFKAFQWDQEIPDPQAPETFAASKLNHDLSDTGNHRVLRDFYHQLIRLRKQVPALRLLDKNHLAVSVFDPHQVVLMHRWASESQTLSLFCFSKSPKELPLLIPGGRWKKVLDSADELWSGGGSTLPAEIIGGATVALHVPPESCVVYQQQAAGSKET